MDHEINGNVPGGSKPIISVLWDPETQNVALSFDNKHFRTWTFVEAVLRMAGDCAMKTRGNNERRAMMLKAQQEIQNERIAQQIINGH